MAEFASVELQSGRTRAVGHREPRGFDEVDQGLGADILVLSAARRRPARWERHGRKGREPHPPSPVASAARRAGRRPRPADNPSPCRVDARQSTCLSDEV